MNRLLLVLMVAGMLIFIQPEKQPALGSSNPVHLIVRGRAALLGKVVHEETNKINSWKIEYIERSKQFSDMDDRSLQLDENGHPHIANGEKHLYYARHDGVQWHYEIVDEAYNVGEYASLVIDKEGYPHISYHDDENGSLKYAYKSVSGWNIETVDSEGDSGVHTSIALNDTGYPHISYWNGHSLKYAYKDDIGWDIQTVGIGGNFNSLALGSTGYAHISYAYRGTPMYAYQDENGWNIEEVDSCDSCYYTSLALDSAGNPHISYGYFQLKYAHLDTGGWHTEVVDVEDGGHPSIALDAAGNPHIINQSGVGYLKYIYLDTNGWNTQLVETGEGAEEFLSLALDRDGYAHISYYQCHLCNSRVSNGEYYYAYQNASGWHIQTVDKEGDISGQTSLASDRYGYAHIAYSSGMEMKYTLQNKDGWKTLVLAVDNKYGESHSSSMALFQDEYPHISYISGAYLNYTYRGTNGWHTETLDAVGLISGGTSIALDVNGNAHIGYASYLEYTYRFGDINYTYKDITGWETNPLVDNEGSEFLSLDLDMDGNPHLSYFNASPNPDSTNGLKYSFRDETGWQVQNVDSGGMYNSLVLDQLGYPHISYDPRKYAYQDANGWHIETVEGCGSTSSLALDNEGYAHISCFWGDKLKYAYQDDLGWHIETVDTGCYRCDGISLALDNDGKPRISYSDNGDLKYAYSVGNFDATYLPLVMK